MLFIHFESVSDVYYIFQFLKDGKGFYSSFLRKWGARDKITAKKQEWGEEKLTLTALPGSIFNMKVFALEESSGQGPGT